MTPLFWDIATVVAAVHLFFATRAPWCFLVGFPATLLHETAHAVVAAVLGLPIERVSLWPRRTAQGWILGQTFVAYPASQSWRLPFVALAPVGWAVVAAWASTHVPEPWPGRGASLVGLAVLLVASLPSRQDLRLLWASWIPTAAYLGILVLGIAWYLSGG